jgi:hypothetical protein
VFFDNSLRNISGTDSDQNQARIDDFSQKRQNIVYYCLKRKHFVGNLKLACWSTDLLIGLLEYCPKSQLTYWLTGH